MFDGKHVRSCVSAAAAQNPADRCQSVRIECKCTPISMTVNCPKQYIIQRCFRADSLFVEYSSLLFTLKKFGLILKKRTFGVSFFFSVVLRSLSYFTSHFLSLRHDWSHAHHSIKISFECDVTGSFSRSQFSSSFFFLFVFTLN